MSRSAASLVFLAVVLGAGAGVFAWYWFAPRPNTGLPPEQLDEVGKMNYRWITASPWERWKWAHAMISAHGIVVDESGAPIPGARVSYAIQIDGDWNPPPTVDMRSDENGRFTVPEGRGYRALVHAVHAEYHTLPESVANVFPRGSLYDEFDRYRFYTDQEVRLVLRKKLPREPLVNRLQEQHRFPSDGSLTLPVDRTGEKQLQVQLVASPAPPGDIRFDWELRIRPKDGKIQVKTERLQMLAPEDGYLPEITMARKIDGEIWIAGEEAEFFLRFDDGNYAWCRVSCDARERFLFYDCNYNPAQSRNLEPGLKVE